jgi:hypothetical protein
LNIKFRRGSSEKHIAKQCKDEFFCKFIFLADFPVPHCSHYYKAAFFWSMTKHYWNASSKFIKYFWRASCKFIEFAKYTPHCFDHLQIRRHRHVVALSSLKNYNWRLFSADLQKNAGLHCLATCFLH